MGAGGNQLREVCDVFCTCQKYELSDQLRVKSIAGGGVDSNGENLIILTFPSLVFCLLSNKPEQIFEEYLHFASG